MKTARKSLVLGLCALLLVSFTLALDHKSFAEEVTITGTVRSGKLVTDKHRERYNIAGVYAEEVNKLNGKKVEVTGRVDNETMTIEVNKFKQVD
jgi:hypothetical protein